MLIVRGYYALTNHSDLTRKPKATMDRGLIWLAEHYLEPFFLWIHLKEKDPTQLQRLSSRMENLGLWENTLVVVTSAQTSYEQVPLWMFMEKRIEPQSQDCSISNVQVQPSIFEYLGIRTSKHSLAGLLLDDTCPSFLISSSFEEEAGVLHHFRKNDQYWFWEGKHLICMEQQLDKNNEIQEQVYNCPEKAQQIFLSNIRMKLPTFHDKWNVLFP